ncbi:glycosyltransferase [Pseudomonas sp. MMS21-TM103]|uniref:glycosyltransferase n=1 Tax=Pseudomonas sp. MMS21 TM103 TaxID=2886506 RepID=UPI001EE13D67|nr:glycosyltransferase [Pseudomonas sp. MMS21 TM103]
MSKSPLVSIVIPTFKPRHFEAALLSALAQSYQPLEILISDDCPDDGIQQIVERHRRHSRHPIRVIRNQPGLGGLMNYTQCVVEAKGEFVKFLNDDDILLNDCVERMVEVLSANPEVSLVTSRRLLIDESGLPLADVPATCCPFDQDGILHGGDLIAYLADSPMNFIGEPSTVMFRRAHLAEIKPNVCCLDGQTVRAINDLAMYVNVLRHGHLAYLCEPLSCFRKHAEQRQQQGDMLPLWQKGVQVFAGQIRVMGLYAPRPNEQVRCHPLVAGAEEWHDFPLRRRLAEAAERAEKPEAVAALLPGLGAFPPLRDAGGEMIQEEREGFRPWLDTRVPTAVQEHLIGEYLQANGGAPRFGILVLDKQDDAGKLRATLDSLSQEKQPYLRLQTLLLCVGEGAQFERADAHVGCRRVSADRQVTTINQMLAQADCDWVMMVDAGDEFTTSGLMIAALELIASAGCRAIYGDEMLRLGDGSLGPMFRPGFNLDLLLSFPAGMARHWLFRRDAFVELGGFDQRYGAAMELDLILRLVESGGMQDLGHVSEPLLITQAPALLDNPDERASIARHLAVRDYPQSHVGSDLPGRYRISYGHQQQPLVSILIPTKDQLPMLQRCVESVLEHTRYEHYEILIIDNNSETPEALEWLAGVEAMAEEKVRVIRYPQPFNFSAINNMAARAARGDYLVLLNNDTAAIRSDWLDEMLNHAQRPEVGIVGAKLLYPDGRIQHAGVVLGLCGPAEHPFIGEPMDAPGYMQRLQVDQNYSAVTAACLMIRKSVYLDVGGMDEEQFKVSYNDIDLCLKTREVGYLTVWTPHAVLMHEGGVSQTKVDKQTSDFKRKRFVAEQDAMYAKWLPALARDPAYNSNFSLMQTGGFKLADSKLSWRPLDAWRPLPVILAHPADLFGCGHYRVMQPFNAQQEAGLIDGALSMGMLQVSDLERFNPDVVVLQRQIGDERLEAIRRMKAFSRAFKVYELDDYLPNLPMKNSNREHMPKDILKSLRRGLSHVDRFVVSTETLAEAFAGLHEDIRVIENRLPVSWWQGLQARRRTSARARVGWAGGAGHAGDLEIIADVVKELAGEVDWVFFGMCPDKLRPFIHEFHPGVPIEQYPAALARLNLDLALAPVEQNLFNECKSNLRLLEYGACGFPVICSDVRCYQGALPVTRVKNRFRDWLDAIRLHLSDLDAAARMGDELRASVNREWMLEGPGLEAWRKAWLPD